MRLGKHTGLGTAASAHHRLAHTPNWQYEPDLAKCSEVEVRFTPAGDGLTRVELEHRYFERHGAGAETMRTAVDDPGGWNGLLNAFGAEAEK